MSLLSITTIYFRDFLVFFWWLLRFLILWISCSMYWHRLSPSLRLDLTGFFSLLFYCCFCFSFRFLWFFYVIQFYFWFWFQLKNLLPVLRSSDFLGPVFIVQKGRTKLRSWLHLIGLKDEKQYHLFFYCWVSSLSMSFILKVPLSFVYFNHLMSKIGQSYYVACWWFLPVLSLLSSFHSCLSYTYPFVSVLCYIVPPDS